MTFLSTTKKNIWEKSEDKLVRIKTRLILPDLSCATWCFKQKIFLHDIWIIDSHSFRIGWILSVQSVEPPDLLIKARSIVDFLWLKHRLPKLSSDSFLIFKFYSTDFFFFAFCIFHYWTCALRIRYRKFRLFFFIPDLILSTVFIRLHVKQWTSLLLSIYLFLLMFTLCKANRHSRLVKKFVARERGIYNG